ncbi:MAG: 30S ribosomal protein S1 [candidate division TM6 bacterium GW2011_GWE2_42_60]|nr:MAG: 30S ribosomal protein S1 [candidate division TM6 bacterium GW2011_GWE2_42_60]HBY05880.1 30S ribosomal protein S1 [Candidatus Dependentiae bacterium]
MSKELIKPSQFCIADMTEEDDSLQPNEAITTALNALYQGILDTYKSDAIVTGTILDISPEGVLIDVNYKSNGLIPLYEFNEVELKGLSKGSTIQVIIDELENFDGDVVLSYEKAKARKAWKEIMDLFEAGKPVEGIVSHKVKGGLSVDIGVPAFLPGSQVDVQRVTDFDHYVGQKVTAHIIKVNQKRGNVIISRRKFLNEQRSEVRKKVLEGLQVGQIIRGAVKNITNYGVFIDIGGVDGLLHITDMTWGRIAHPSELLKIGDAVSVKVLSFDPVNEKISLGIKQLSENPWSELPETVKMGEKIEGIVSSITDYGLFVEVAKGVEGLVHISEISWTDRITDLHKHYKAGQTIEALVVSLDKENRRMSLSIKQLKENPWDAVVGGLEVGQIVTGTVRNITDFGIFVQLSPGVDGLIHISDLSWTEHIKHPSDLFKKGDEVRAIITDINREKRKISLGLKQLDENPWENLEAKYPVDSVVEGEVSKITDFGAFVKLASGIEGLVHISELSGNNVEHVEDIIKVGDKSQFRVIKVNQEEHKLGLSLKPKGSERPPVKRQPKEGGEQRPARRERVEAVSHTPSRMKSQFQLELEKHSARQSNDTEGTKEAEITEESSSENPSEE